MKKLRGKLTYANVMVTILAFVVLAGGTAFASQALLPKDSVGTRQLKKGAVTPGKLSAKTRLALVGPVGPKGDRGPQGAEGPKGTAGTTGNEPFVVDVNSGEVDPVSGPVALKGTSSWTAEEADAGLLLGTLSATGAATPEAQGNNAPGCEIVATIFDNGVVVGGASMNIHTSSPSEGTSKLWELTQVAFDEPGVHTLTAEVVPAYGCEPGVKVDNLHLAVAKLG
jgi:hypothetical protein